MKGIYQIENIVNSKKYVGSAVNFRRRVTRHIRKLKDGVHRNTHLQRSWGKHGSHCFFFTMLLFCEREELQRYEQWFIDNLQPEYNIAKHVTMPFLGRKLVSGF